MKLQHITVLLLLAAVSCSRSPDATQPQIGDVIVQMIEKEIAASFTVTNDGARPPHTAVVVSEHDLTGTWATPRGFEVAAVTFQQTTGRHYKVDFMASGCEMDWTLGRTATYAGPVITFDRPVMEYTSQPYTRMYTMRTNGVVCLIPSTRVADLEAGKPNAEFHLFRRTEHPATCNAIWQQAPTSTSTERATARQ